MPSFRIAMTIGQVRPGYAPDEVLTIAAAAASELTTVEASGVDVVAGAARITVRFTSDDGELAVQIGEYVAGTTDAAAEVLARKVTERVGGRWYPLR